VKRRHRTTEPVIAAGGIVFRQSARPMVGIVQLRKDKSWVLPKGKLKHGEQALAAARREVEEETGHDVTVLGFSGYAFARRR
jgi:8-oxo-dGTP diphosphatase